MSRRWTDDEIFYLQECWGKISVPKIAERLGRSENAVIIKANKLSTGAFLNCGDYISFNQLKVALTGSSRDSYDNISWIKNRNFPIHTKRVRNGSFQIVYFDEFWKWAEENRSFVDFSKFEEGLLGIEPSWVKVQRKYDTEEKLLAEPRVWTDEEDARLKMYLLKGVYTVYEISRAIQRTSAAIQKRMIALKTPLRPVKSRGERYTSEDIEFITTGIKNGMGYIVMANRLMRSDKALRGLVYNNYLTEDLDKVRKMIGDGKFYDGMPEPKVYQGICLTRHRATVKKELSKLAVLLKFLKENRCMNNKIKKLKPCPFCGAEGESFVSINKSWDDFYVKCFECGARSGLGPDEETVLEAWNARSDSNE